MLWRRARPEHDKKCNEADGVNRNKDRNEGKEKFLGEIAHLDLTSRFYTIRLVHSTSMNFRYSLLLVLGLALGARAEDLKSIDSYRDVAARGTGQWTIPDWQQTPEAVETSCTEALK